MNAVAHDLVAEGVDPMKSGFVAYKTVVTVLQHAKDMDLDFILKHSSLSCCTPSQS